jgi:acyl transferase domain-containing protein/acyl carrier protein
MTRSEEAQVEGVAIVGMSGRFPGARDVAQLWRNLRQGVEGRTALSEEQLEAAGVEPALRSHPDYVRAGFPLEEPEYFDAAFFGFTPREADVLDPQHRLFLECAWEALESAGCDSERFRGAISLFASSSLSSYMLRNLMTRPDVVRTAGSYSLLLANDKDFLPTRISHKLDLKGPSLAVQTACSSSLVAVHLACQSLLTGESDLALAGGVSVVFPQNSGYLYQEGMILSPDGHCRAFDEKSQGTVTGSGVGVVALKRLADALEDGDTIYAVIRGSAINNDGASKVGYTAPSVDGQAAAISEALAVAGVSADTLQYVEAHGTATPLGDPIEIAALHSVFAGHSRGPGTCALGSVKTNVGHLDAAAGVTGLIKTALALHHRELPPSLHFTRPNPRIDFSQGPFFVNTELREWRTDGGPRRAGVSSFGIGGTNAHAVLEEAPRPAPAASEPASPWQLLVLSARGEAALEAATDNLAAHLARHPELRLADVAHTLQVGRRRLSHRRVLVCRDTADAQQALASRDAQRLLSRTQEATQRPVTFLFPGQGAQHVGMARGLYTSEPTFRQHVDTCCDKLTPHLGFDLREVLYPPESRTEEATKRLVQTSVAQPALFVVEYALARLWMSLGVKPQAMVGHSLGEYVAACLAGVLSLDDALALVAARGQLMQRLPAGSMLSVALPEESVRPLLGERLALAAVNAPGLCVVAGPTDAVEALEAELARRGVEHRRLHTSHAFHSAMMDPILAAFEERLRGVRLSPPKIPYVSNLTGTWITAEQATDPRRWVEHLRHTVRFADGMKVLLAEPERVLLEVGPGQSLGSLARQCAGRAPELVVLPSLRGPRDTQPDHPHFLSTVGQLWLAGVKLDCAKLHAGQRRQRLPLPTYPFQRQRHWVEPGQANASAGPTQAPAPARKLELADWFHARSWKQVPLARRGAVRPGSRWLVLADGAGLGERLVERLRAAGAEPVLAHAAEDFVTHGPRRYALDPAQSEHLATLLGTLAAADFRPEHIVHLCGVSRTPEQEPVFGHGPVLALASALKARGLGDGLSLTVVASGTHDVSGGDAVSPERASVLGPCAVLPQELPGLRCRSIDVVVPEPGSRQEERLVTLLLEELTSSQDAGRGVAYRGGRRWVKGLEAVRLPEPEGTGRLRERGVYLITGGLERMGLALAEQLARAVQARLVLVGRTALPARAEWEARLAASGEQEPLAPLLRRLLALEKAGAEVLVARADVSQPELLQQAITQARERFGALHGVIHAAGEPERHAALPVEQAMRPEVEAGLKLQAQALYALADTLRGQALDFVALPSSLASFQGAHGLSLQAAADRFLDALAARQGESEGTPWLRLSWDGAHLQEDEAFAALARLLAAGGAARWVVSPEEPSSWRAALAQPTGDSPASEGTQPRGSAHPRPQLATAYVAPRDSIERGIADIWQELLGVDPVGIHDSFFELGGHSLLGTQVGARVREAFQVELPLRALFETPTVAGLALAVVQRRAAELDSESLESLLAELEQNPSQSR